MRLPKEGANKILPLKRRPEEVTESDFNRYGPDLIRILKARDAKKEAKLARSKAQAEYSKAKGILEEMKTNLLAAFESSEEPNNLTQNN